MNHTYPESDEAKEASQGTTWDDSQGSNMRELIRCLWEMENHFLFQPWFPHPKAGGLISHLCVREIAVLKINSSLPELTEVRFCHLIIKFPDFNSKRYTIMYLVA